MIPDYKTYKPYIDYLLDNKINEQKGVELLTSCKKLNDAEKRFIYMYVYPRPLKDRELPSRIQLFRKENNIPMTGLLTPNTGEVQLIIEAARTYQYRNFIKHLGHAFSDPSNIFPIKGEETADCSICGKILYEKDKWDKLILENPNTPEKTNKEYLAFGSTKSSVVLCADCLIQLITALEILKELDKDFLYHERSFTWENLKL
jgi:hypothetical protein